MIAAKPHGYWGRPVPAHRLARYLRQGLPSGPEGPGKILLWGAEAGGGQAGPQLPACLVAPSTPYTPGILGAPSVGGTISANLGLWSVTDLAFRWLADGAEIDKPASWVIPDALFGAAITLEVTATGADGVTVRETDPLTVIAGDLIAIGFWSDHSPWHDTSNWSDG
ncbi:hypothetical protein [Amaricoccus solimangrovi]|uniref:Uncharacterized protein n=1 Tax=Amaricoccus solimangrovi TaxID=2589815 RepID=A0A501WUJ3_9RHOB|nr:hypothetical protein [Amaricoccus solimangrovi]TPE53088.1 hypothetical protein FJM51_03430 [Amaricoccus solimangrovi]